MIIINQDKDELVNFNNISHIWIDNTWLDSIEKLEEEKFEINADDFLLGIYDTKERAKEILEEIIKEKVIEDGLFYEMPKEDCLFYEMPKK